MGFQPVLRSNCASTTGWLADPSSPRLRRPRRLRRFRISERGWLDKVGIGPQRHSPLYAARLGRAQRTAIARVRVRRVRSCIGDVSPPMKTTASGGAGGCSLPGTMRSRTMDAGSLTRGRRERRAALRAAAGGVAGQVVAALAAVAGRHAVVETPEQERRNKGDEEQKPEWYPCRRRRAFERDLTPRHLKWVRPCIFGRPEKLKLVVARIGVYFEPAGREVKRNARTCKSECKPRARNKCREDEQAGERARPFQHPHEPKPPPHAGSLTRSRRERRADKLEPLTIPCEERPVFFRRTD